MNAATGSMTALTASVVYQLARLVAGLPTPAANGHAPGDWPAVIEVVAAADCGQRSAVLQVELTKRGLPVDATLRAIAAIKPDAPAPPPARQMSFTADELLDAHFPKASCAIPGIVPEGLTLLGGRPKLGKSWLCLEAAMAKAAGGKFLGRDVGRGSVDFFALEDPPRRLQTRLKMLGWPRGLDVTFHHDLSAIGGGLAGLPGFIDARRPAMVVVDTFSRAAQGLDQRSVGAVTDYLGPNQQAAVNAGCALLVTDHHRKQPRGTGAPEDGDHLDELLESTAKAAVADAILGLFRKRGERGATLKVSGRDLEDLELAIEMDSSTCSWQLLGEASEVRQTARQKKVIAALTRAGGTANVKAIQERTDLDKSAVSRVLQELADLNRVEPLPRQGREQLYRLITEQQ